ncbi:GntP family gluconate:H+ symporter [Kineococcus radiotolerans]|uniref:GntP family gluconate:H+ symporter n=1 Tax=Kineococcus radiotolerans TaxID=131568 RepID=A0A7W4TNL3_KINRA|nr:GntP family permease [Kineococcus radiotolerans]MBB2902234.1 GntP family gluconate:H+ symporter [Kineococcus radiotolerans]
METVTPAYGTSTLLLIAAAAVALLLLLIIRFKLHAFVALVLVSAVTAVVTVGPDGSLLDVVDVLTAGFGSTLASVALLVGFGVMIGRLLEVTGGAQVLADTLVARFGEKRAPLALGVASLIFGFPIFFDAGLVVFLPIIFSVARRFGGSVLTYALPAAGAFAVMHAFVPPHPGPVAAGELLGADIGVLILVGLVLAVPTWFTASYLFGLWAGRRTDVPLPAEWAERLAANTAGQAGPSGTAGAATAPGATGGTGTPGPAAPRFSTVLLVLLLPLVLIFLNTGLNTLATAGAVDGEATWVQVLRLVGQTPIALLIAVLVTMVVLSRGRLTRGEVEDLANSSLGPVCAVILITGAGGMFGGVLRASGIGGALADTLAATGLPVIVAAFIISLGLRVAQGSATVALTTTAGLMAPTVEATAGLSSLDPAFIVIAIAAGATALSHVNDSGFWLVGRFLGMDVPTTLRTWTVMETLIGLVGFALAFLGYLLL